MIITFSGKASAGKTTAADILLDHCGYSYRTSFAAKLKELVQRVYGLSYNQVTLPELKSVVDSRWGMSPREIMERVGDALRAVHPESWIRSLTVSLAVDFTVDDVRFPNEVDYIRSLGGYVVRIEREGARAVGGVPGHASDSVLDSYRAFDGIIVNDGSIEELRTKVVAMAQHLREVDQFKRDGFPALPDLGGGAAPKILGS